MSAPVTAARRVVILCICCLSLLMVSMDSTIVNVALPSIRADLHASIAGLQWVVDAYTLVVATFLMLGGSLADRFGRRRVFQSGMAVFALGSLLCSLAPSMPWLIAFRAMQALGGCMLNPVAMSIIVHTFDDPKERAKAIGAWGAVVGVTMALGPVAGGVLTQGIGWRSIFWVNLPVGIGAIMLAACYIPESKALRARRADPVAQVLVLLALASLTYGVIEGPQTGWHSATIVGLFALSAAAVVALLFYETRRHEPLIDLRFFHSVPFSCAMLLALFTVAPFAGFLFLNSLYLQEARGLSALLTGLYMLPMALGMAVCSPLSGRLLNAYGVRPPIMICGAMIAASTLMLTQLSVATPLWILLFSYLLFGIGFGMANTPITNSAVTGMPRAQAGFAAALASTSRQIGAVLGVAGAGAVVGAQGASGPNFATATHGVWWTMAALGGFIALLGFVATSPWARRTAKHISHLLQEPAAPDDPKRLGQA